jgi:hypothetical protein
LQQLGWTVGQNIRIDYRWGDGQARYLKGEKPADLPVQALTKYETVINLKTECDRVAPSAGAARETLWRKQIESL